MVAQYDPAIHDEQAVEEEAEYLPAAQAPVTAVKPVVAQYDPAGQLVQETRPEVEANVPVAQLEQDPPLPYIPALQ